MQMKNATRTTKDLTSSITSIFNLVDTQFEKSQIFDFWKIVNEKNLYEIRNSKVAW